MGVKVRWTDPALEDLEQALEFIATDNLDAAKSLGRKAWAATRTLRNYPMKGRLVPEYQDAAIRELIVGPFRIIYSVKALPTVWVLATVRAERLLEPPPPGLPS
jgi:plasmid stabilization system protein ParE